jgi:hypothetical protein
MPEDTAVEVVQVSDVRKNLKVRLSQKKPLVLMRNSSVVAILLCVEGSVYGRVEHPRLEAKRLRAELQAALDKILRS